MFLDRLFKKKELPIEIRCQTPEDVEEVNQLFYQTYLTTYPNETAGITRDDIHDMFKDTFSEEGIQKSKEFIKNLPENYIPLIAKVNGKIVGVCRIVRREANNKIKSIYILPQYQGKGVGSKLWSKVLKLLNPEKETFVETAEYNQQAIKFYKSKGFVETGKTYQHEQFRMKSGAQITDIELKRPADK